MLLLSTAPRIISKALVARPTSKEKKGVTTSCAMTEQHRFVLGMRVDAISYIEVTKLVMEWARAAQSCYVCVANVHMTMETYDSLEFRHIVNGANLVVPDGMPLVWALHLLGVTGQQRVYGPDLTRRLCEAAAQEEIPVALYGGTPESLGGLSQFLTKEYPTLRIVCRIAPPFRSLTPEEDALFTLQIANSGARIVFVGVGCPKQERWMASHVGRLPAVMVGVGAAFDFQSGRVRQAPVWMQLMGLEWFHRLLMEPRRLWKRYLRHNPRFLFFLTLQLLGLGRHGEEAQ